MVDAVCVAPFCRIKANLWTFPLDFLLVDKIITWMLDLAVLQLFYLHKYHENHSLNTCACNNYAQFCQHQSRHESLKQLCEVEVGSIAAMIHHCVHSNNILILKTSPEATSCRAKKEGEQ